MRRWRLREGDEFTESARWTHITCQCIHVNVMMRCLYILCIIYIHRERERKQEINKGTTKEQT